MNLAVRTLAELLPLFPGCSLAITTMYPLRLRLPQAAALPLAHLHFEVEESVR